MLLTNYILSQNSEKGEILSFTSNIENSTKSISVLKLEQKNDWKESSILSETFP
jgi:hypothetical protein